MALKLSTFEIGMIAAFVVVTGAGIGGYIYTNSLAQEAKTSMDTAGAELQKHVKQRYLPSAANIKTLETNISELDGTLKPILERLQDPKNNLAKIETKNPVTWKNSDLDPTVQRLTALARAKRIALPQDYYFGFSTYQSNNPSEQATQLLGKQLYGVDQLSTILFNASDTGSISSLRGIRRTFDEEGASAAQSTEALKGSVKAAASGLYRVYPFEMEFTATTIGLRTFVNALAQGPVVFIIRSLQVNNTKMESPRQSDLSPSGGDEASKAQGRDFVFGGEQLQVRARVDMVEWLSAQEAETARPAKRPLQPARAR